MKKEIAIILVFLMLIPVPLSVAAYDIHEFPGYPGSNENNDGEKDAPDYLPHVDVEIPDYNIKNHEETKILSTGIEKVNGIPFTDVANLRDIGSGHLLLTKDNTIVLLEFYGLTPGGTKMPSASIIGFDIFITKSDGCYKWGYIFRLPNTMFKCAI